MIKLGYCCQNLSLQPAGIKYRATTETSVRGLTKPAILKKIAEICTHNLNTLRAIMFWNTALRIWSYRVPTDIFPLYDHPDYKWVYDTISAYPSSKIQDPVLDELLFAKDSARSAILAWAENAYYTGIDNVWFGTHPGQYTVISSRKPEVNVQGIATLCAQINLLDELGASDDPEQIQRNINIHVSNGSKDVKETAKIVYENLQILEDYYKDIGCILSFENEDTGVWTPEVLLETFPNIPVLFDVHHYRCNSTSKSGLPDKNLLQAISDQWQKQRLSKPLWHHSSSHSRGKNGKCSRSHAAYMENADLKFLHEYQEYFDAVELEVKMKDLALIKSLNYLKRYDK